MSLFRNIVNRISPPMTKVRISSNIKYLTKPLKFNVSLKHAMDSKPSYKDPPVFKEHLAGHKTWLLFWSGEWAMLKSDNNDGFAWARETDFVDGPNETAQIIPFNRPTVVTRPVVVPDTRPYAQPYAVKPSMPIHVQTQCVVE